jgi:hypothetical protein
MFIKQEDLPEDTVNIIYSLLCFNSHNYSNQDFKEEMLKDINLKFFRQTPDRLFIETVYKNQEVTVAVIHKISFSMKDDKPGLPYESANYTFITDLSLNEFIKLIQKVKDFIDSYMNKKELKRLEYYSQKDKFNQEALNSIKNKLNL